MPGSEDEYPDVNSEVMGVLEKWIPMTEEMRNRYSVQVALLVTHMKGDAKKWIRERERERGLD